MRIGVIGAGAIGGTFAALLSAGGHSVEVTARGSQLDAIAAGGIRLTGGFGDVTARVEVGETLTETPDLAIVATKAQDAIAAMRQNAEFLSGIPVVVIQNGLEGLTAAKPVLPRSDIIGGLAVFAASFLSPGSVSITTPGTLFLGGELVPTLYVSRIIGDLMPVVRTDNFEGAQWSKLIINHVNALAAITGLSVQETIAHSGIRRLMSVSMREAIDVARAREVKFEKLQGLTDARLSLFRAAPLWAAQALPLVMARRMGSVPNPGSTQQSIRRGQPTEIDFLNGAVVAAGAAAGVATPVSSLLTDLVHEVEQTGEFLSPPEVLARV